MNETLKRALSGFVYVAIMWFGTSSSDTSKYILFSVITIISTYEMWKLRKGKSITFHYFYVWALMLALFLEVEILGDKLRSNEIIDVFIQGNNENRLVGVVL